MAMLAGAACSSHLTLKSLLSLINRARWTRVLARGCGHTALPLRARAATRRQTCFLKEAVTAN